MKIIDEKFQQQKMQYILQCILATLAVGTVLLVLNAASNTAVIGALGASAFIAFTIPNAQVSRSRFLIGGYFIGTGVGSAFYFLTMMLMPFLSFISSGTFMALMAAAALGFTIFFMVLLNFEHPPAAGLALGLVLNEWSFKTVLVVLAGILMLSVLRHLLRPFLRNLL